jgi:heme exporter protein D
MRPALIVKSNSSFSVVRKSIGFLAAIASLHVIMGFTFSNMHSSNSTFLEMLFYASIVWVPMLIIYVLVFISIRKRKKERKRILNEGIPATAKILNCWETGTTDTYKNIKMGFKLEVKHPELGKYQVEFKQYVPEIYCTDDIINVKIDKADKNKVTIVY